MNERGAKAIIVPHVQRGVGVVSLNFRRKVHCSVFQEASYAEAKYQLEYVRANKNLASTGLKL